MATAAPTRLFLDGCALDLLERTIRYPDGRTNRLTVTEADLVRWLARTPGEPHARDALLVAVWGYHPSVRSRTVDVTVRRLRKKIEVDPSNPTHLCTRHGQGYLLTGARAEQTPRQATNVRPATTCYVAGVHAPGALAVALTPGIATTLTGPPGVGKSRLAREVSRAATAFSGVWWVDAASLDVAAGLDRPLAGALGLDAVDPSAVRAALRMAGDSLLVLDNVDGVGGITRWLESLLEAVPRLAVVSTRRSALGLRGEVVVAVPPLSPSAAAALFEVRARRARPGYELSAADRAAIEQALPHLDGLPLAIELAAAQTAVLSPVQLVELLRDSVAEPLQAALERAYRTLDPEAKKLLAACAVFPAAFDARMAAGVLGGDDLHGAANALRSLVAASWVQPVGGVRHEPLFSLLHSVRAFATAALETSGRTGDVVSRHTEVALAAAEAGRGRYEDLAAALARVPPAGDATLRARVLMAWLEIARYADPPEAQRVWFNELCALPHSGGLAVRRVLHHAFLDRAAGEMERARSRLEGLWASLDDHVGASDPIRAGVALGLARTLANQGAPEAAGWAERAVGLGQGATETEAHLICAGLYLMNGESDRSQAHLDALEGRTLDRGYTEFERQRSRHMIEAGDCVGAEARLRGALADARPGIQTVKLMLDLARALAGQGREAAALDVLEAAAGASLPIGAVQAEAVARSNAAAILHRLGRFGEAEAGYRAAIDAAARSGTRYAKVMAEASLAVLQVERHAPDGTADLDRSIDALRGLGTRRSTPWFLACRGIAAIHDGHLELASACVAEARQLPTTEAIGAAVSLADRLLDWARAGRDGDARRALLTATPPTLELRVPRRLAASIR